MSHRHKAVIILLYKHRMTKKYSTQNSLKPIEQQIEDAAHAEASRFADATVEGRQAVVEYLKNFARDVNGFSSIDSARDSAITVLESYGASIKSAEAITKRMFEKFSTAKAPDTNVADINYRRARYSGRN